MNMPQTHVNTINMSISLQTDRRETQREEESEKMTDWFNESVYANTCKETGCFASDITMCLYMHIVSLFVLNDGCIIVNT